MIELALPDYCSDCPEFDPDISREYTFGGNCITSIHCEHECRCLSIYRYLKSQIEEIENA